MEINRVVINGNAGLNDGGGIRNLTSGDLDITNSILNENTAELGFGGAIENERELSLKNVTISGNRADHGGGGGISQDSPSSTTNLVNTILAGNTISNDSSDGGPDCFGVLTSEGHNLIGSVSGCTIVGGQDDIFGQDPLLGSLADHGGPTLTMPLKPGSPAIDAGDNTVCAAPPVDNRDQRGIPRPLDGNGDLNAVCDIGAFEYVATPAEAVACKKDAWRSVYRADGSSFKNQGDCIHYVNTGG